jgi:hypothetical protein
MRQAIRPPRAMRLSRPPALLALALCSRMESTGLPMRIQVSETTYELLPLGERARWESRGTVEIKGGWRALSAHAHGS